MIGLDVVWLVGDADVTAVAVAVDGNLGDDNNCNNDDCFYSSSSPIFYYFYYFI